MENMGKLVVSRVPVTGSGKYFKDAYGLIGDYEEKKYPPTATYRAITILKLLWNDKERTSECGALFYFCLLSVQAITPALSRPHIPTSLTLLIHDVLEQN